MRGDGRYQDMDGNTGAKVDNGCSPDECACSRQTRQESRGRAASAEDVAFQIIVNAGEGRARIYSAIQAYAQGDLERYRQLLAEAESFLTNAHSVQASYLQEKACVPDAGPDYLLVHAQDILMTATSEKEMAKALIDAFEQRMTRYLRG